MFSKFENLDEEKKQRILNAAMKEFAAKGYDHASTNKIVEDAGIAKGLLFHYFKSKKQLFLYLYDTCIQRVLSEVTAGVVLAEKDFFARLLKAQMVKLGLMSKWPDLMDFLAAAYMEDSAAVKQELDARNRDLLLINFRKAFDDIDTSAFREDLDVGSVINTVAWAFEGFANQTLQRVKYDKTYVPDYDALFAGAEKYGEFLKKCFYK